MPTQTDFQAMYAALVLVLCEHLRLPAGRRKAEDIVAAVEALRGTVTEVDEAVRKAKVALLRELAAELSRAGSGDCHGDQFILGASKALLGHAEDFENRANQLEATEP